jgi:alpha-beta hydrolase superfamily lysophospholipase
MTGPHMTADNIPAFDATLPGFDLEASLAASESRFSDIRSGAAKHIVWADSATRSRTPVSLVYIHGFSASAAEIRPLPDEIASALGANLYFTRLAGHGRTSEAMGEPRIRDWLADFSESLAIGEALGERIVVIGTSTGASLVTAALADPQIRRRISAVVLVSPNYRINRPGAALLTMPLAGWLTRMLIGPTYNFRPANERHAAHWTTSYPSSALLPMAELVRLSAKVPIEEIHTPALFLYSSLDQVIRPDRVRKVAGRWGGSCEIIDVGATGDPSNHVIAGDILSPQTTAALRERILTWLRRTLDLR